MGDQYTSVTITGYDSNPPVDDGSQTEANRVKWSTIKTKLDDPLKTAIETINTNVVTAFGKIDGGVTSTAISYQVVSGDQGKLVRASASGITLTTPDATDVDAPFVFGFLNDSDGDITLVCAPLPSSGAQTIDGDASVTVQAGAGGRIRTDGTNWFTDGQNFQRTQITPQGYLTLVNEATSPLTPFPASDQSAKTAVYYRPHVGNLLPIPNGTSFIVREFSELTLTLVAAHAASSILDVFAFDDSGTIRIGTGPAWTTATAGSGARGTGAGTTELELLKGLPVNKVAATMRNSSTTYSVAAKSAIYLGSLHMDGTNGQITCHVSYGQSRKWGVWNYYNRDDIFLKAGDATASWTFNTNGFQAANASTANSLTIFSGLPEEPYQLDYAINITHQSVGAAGDVANKAGIGFNSTIAASGRVPIAQFTADSGNASNLKRQESLIASYTAVRSIGINTVTALDGGFGLNSFTFQGTEASMILSAKWRG